MTTELGSSRLRIGGGGWLTLIVLLSSLLSILPGPGSAAVPEPDAVIYGLVLVDDSPLAPGSEVSARRGGDVLASYAIGDDPLAGDFYVLRLRLEDGDDVAPPASRVGDAIDIYVADDVVSAGESLTSRGMVARRDFALSLTGDFDDDGVADFEDNCAREPNPLQLDTNANGIGDECEERVHPTPRFEFVGHVDNVADPESPADLGSVGWSYEVGSSEVTNAQYVDFLNAVAAQSDPNALYSELMGTDGRGGILRSDGPGVTSYRVRALEMGNKPVNFVSWLDAARYANWLHNAQPSGAQDSSTTEAGAFDLSSPDPELTAEIQEGAVWSLPLEDEWYKAAYFDPAADYYWMYPTRSDLPPVPAEADALGGVTNPGANVAVYASAADWNGQDGNVVAVNDTTSLSAYGVDGLGGNVAEWLAAPTEDSARVLRGGGYDGDAASLSKPERTLLDPTLELPNVGFRVVRVADLPGDEDGDGVRADGDGDGTPGNHPCSEGNVEGCDDNCTTAYNPLQNDEDADGLGDECECDWDPIAGRPHIPGDASGDGIVDGADYTLWADHFEAEDPAHAEGDFNCDGEVDGADYTIWADHFGETAR